MNDRNTLYRAMSCSIGMILLAFVASAQSVRCTYEYSYKLDPAGEYRSAPDMRLDYCEGRSAWYSESKYMKDSLSIHAFDENGSIVDNKVYGQMAQIQSKLFESTTIDFQNRSFIQHYQTATIRLNGKGELIMPAWELLDEEKEIEGYHCHKATTSYLGRNWTVWYTEEIPLNIGPWLLWGAPGLILEAQDADNLFAFRFTGAQQFSGIHRFEQLRKIYMVSRSKRREKDYKTDELRIIENTYTKLRNDVEFFNEAHGIRTSRVTNASGKELDQSAYFRYIPLIPTEYWRNNR